MGVVCWIRSLSDVAETWWDAGGIFACPVWPVKISTEYLAQIETAISIIYGKYVYTYG